MLSPSPAKGRRNDKSKRVYRPLILQPRPWEKRVMLALMMSLFVSTGIVLVATSKAATEGTYAAATANYTVGIGIGIWVVVMLGAGLVIVLKRGRVGGR